MARIPDGCILMARQILKSDVWVSKPSWYLKVWAYIIMQVNHKDNKMFKRGENFFTYNSIYNDCCLRLDGIEAKSVDNCIRWLRATTQITTRKTTRGIVIFVNKYEDFQNLLNYRNDTENDNTNAQLTRQERDRNDTINKNVKNDKNEYVLAFESLWKLYPKKEGHGNALKHFVSQVKTEADIVDIRKALDNYLLKIAAEKTEYKFIKMGSSWFNQWRDWVNWKPPEAESKPNNTGYIDMGRGK